MPPIAIMMPTSIQLVSVLSLLGVLSAFAAGDDGEWVTIFDGESLDGWVTEGGRYDGDADWSIEAGALTGREGSGGSGGLIYTAKKYRNFELELDTTITYPFDSGIFVRMTPDKRGAQVTIDYRPGGEVGGIYSDGWFFHNPDGAAKFTRDEWNHFKVRCVGEPMHLTVWMNGDLLTDYRFPEESGAFAQAGLIGLQVHGSPGAPEGSNVKFKHIRVRELPADAGTYFESDEAGLAALTDEARAIGWTALFDGESLAGWEAAGGGTGFRAQDGVMQFLVAGDSPYIMTAKDYRDFHLRLDFKIARMANSGLFLRADRKGGDPAYSGCEIQILDDFNWETVTDSKLAPYQFTGGLYGSVPPGVKDALKPLGEWNTYDIVYQGRRICVALNGKVLYDVDTHEVPGEPKFADRVPAGFIGMQRHAPGQVEGEAYAWFRNIFIREL